MPDTSHSNGRNRLWEDTSYQVHVQAPITKRWTGEKEHGSCQGTCYIPMLKGFPVFLP